MSDYYCQHQGNIIHFIGPVYAENDPYRCVGIRVMVNYDCEQVVNFGEELYYGRPRCWSVDEMCKEDGYERTGVYVSLEDMATLHALSNAARVEELRYYERSKSLPVKPPRPDFYKESRTFQWVIIARQGLDPYKHKLVQMTGEIVRTKAAEKKEGAKKND